MNWKQLFCSHVWKTVKTEKLREQREKDGYKWGVTMYANFVYYGHHQSCVKCNQKKITEVRLLRL